MANNFASRPLTLLLAEDNLPDALLVEQAIRMESLPVAVITAVDGERAIDFVVKAETDSSAPSPDLIVLDLNLPRADGFEVLERVRASSRYKDLPVLIMTSSDSPADRKRAAELGAAYFRKPASYDEFVKIGAVLRSILERRGLIGARAGAQL